MIALRLAVILRQRYLAVTEYGVNQLEYLRRIGRQFRRKGNDCPRCFGVVIASCDLVFVVGVVILDEVTSDCLGHCRRHLDVAGVGLKNLADEVFLVSPPGSGRNSLGNFLRPAGDKLPYTPPPRPRSARSGRAQLPDQPPISALVNTQSQPRPTSWRELVTFSGPAFFSIPGQRAFGYHIPSATELTTC